MTNPEQMLQMFISWKSVKAFQLIEGELFVGDWRRAVQWNCEAALQTCNARTHMLRAPAVDVTR